MGDWEKFSETSLPEKENYHLNMKNYDGNKELSYLQYLDESNLYGRAMSQKLPVDGFTWVENKSKYNKDFRENCN